MIVVKRAKPSGLIRYVGRPLVVLFAFDLAIAAAYVFAGWKWLALPDVPLSIFGGVLGVIVGFRNSSAYARLWEARTIWGGIVNHSRSFAREVQGSRIPDEHAVPGDAYLSGCGLEFHLPGRGAPEVVPQGVYRRTAFAGRGYTRLFL